jgi:hypothetical protein
MQGASRLSPEERAVIYDSEIYDNFTSSNVKRFWYDYETAELGAEFDPKDDHGNSRGEVTGYLYDDVPEQVVVNLMRAESKGKFVRKRLRGRYSYHRIY